MLIFTHTGISFLQNPLVSILTTTDNFANTMAEKNKNPAPRDVEAM
jgi:hypothetical protein